MEGSILTAFLWGFTTGFVIFGVVGSLYLQYLLRRHPRLAESLREARCDEETARVREMY